jgi:hypothetical protein
MKRRFSILIQEYGSDREVELCQVDSNPQNAVAGLRAKTLTVHGKGNTRRRSKIPKYTSVRVVDNQAGRTISP